MRNWPKSRRKKIQSARTTATKILFKWAKHIPNIEVKAVKSIKEVAERHSLSRRPNQIKCPERLEINLAGLGISDVFFQEDFGNLKNGLNDLFKVYPASHSLGIEDLNKWFEDISNIRTGTWMQKPNYTLDFRDGKKTGITQHLKYLSLTLHYCHPSIIILSGYATPSDQLRNKFFNLIKSNPPADIEITGFSLLKGITSYQSYSEHHTRQSELDELFLEVNRSIVSLFRGKFKSGLSQFGPLPMLEILDSNLDFREIPNGIAVGNCQKILHLVCSTRSQVLIAGIG
jgi:hypothetical protein